MHEGHRKRMLQRLEHAEGLQDHELLEILLFNAIPRKNTNPLAHELLTSFPSMGELFRADYAELLNVDGECGGFNLMWAAASGQAAAKGALRDC